MECLDVCKDKGVIIRHIHTPTHERSFSYDQNNAGDKWPDLSFCRVSQATRNNPRKSDDRWTNQLFKTSLAKTIMVRLCQKAAQLLYTAVRTIEARRGLNGLYWPVRRDLAYPCKQDENQECTSCRCRRRSSSYSKSYTMTGNGRLLFPNSKRPDDMLSATTINRALSIWGWQSQDMIRATLATNLSEMLRVSTRTTCPRQRQSDWRGIFTPNLSRNAAKCRKDCDLW